MSLAACSLWLVTCPMTHELSPRTAGLHMSDVLSVDGGRAYCNLSSCYYAL